MNRSAKKFNLHQRTSTFLSFYSSELLLFCALALFMVLPSGAHAVWTIQGVDTPRNFSDMTSRSIAVDSANHPHIAYGGDHLYHAYFNGTNWLTETVDNSPGVGQYASIAIDSNNKVHISYYDAVNGDLKYATNKPGIWESITLDSNVVGYTSIAVDSANNVHISYNDSTNGDLKYATNKSGSWGTTTVDSAVEYNGFDIYNSIAVDSSNNAHISYHDYAHGYLKYATCNSNSNCTNSANWSNGIIDSVNGAECSNSIAVKNGKIHIGYSETAISSSLKYAICNSNCTTSSANWTKETVDSSSNIVHVTSLSVDNSNIAHISYYDVANYDLKYATNFPGLWTKQTIDSTGDVGEISSIAVDSSGKIHISYYDDSNSDLKYAACNSNCTNSANWIKTIVDSSGKVGEGTSIAVDSNNKAHISYYDVTNGDLKYATNVSGIWVSIVIDSVGDVGKYSAIALDSNNKAHISYYDGTNQNLKYATNDASAGYPACGSGWYCTTVDSSTSWDVNGQTSIALDSSNKVHISYYDSTNGDLGYATNSSGLWAISWPDTGADVGDGNSIAVKNNTLHISYYDRTNNLLKYATCNSNCTYSANWTNISVDSAYLLFYINKFHSSIAVGSNNTVHLSYSDSYLYYNGWGYVQKEDLKYATCNSNCSNSANWTKVTIDSGSGAGHASIAVDGNNKAHISYSADWALKYATNVSGSWVTTTVDSEAVGWYNSIKVDNSNKTHISYYDNINGDLKYATNATVDVTPPVGSITINNINDTYTNNDLVTLNLSCEDLQSTPCYQMQFSNDGTDSAAEPYASSKYWFLESGNGLKTVYVKFRDSSGNWSISYSDTITLDTTPPSNGAITVNSGAVNTTSPNVTLTVSASDSNGVLQMQFSNDGTNWQTPPEDYYTTRNWTLSAGDGTKTVYVKFKDSAGNWSADLGYSDTITLDTTLPTGSISVAGGASYTKTTGVTLTLLCSDGGTGCSQMQFSNDGTNWEAAEAFATTKSRTLITGDGTKTVYVKFKDSAGNWSSLYIDTIILDTALPTGSVSIAGGDAYTTTTSVTLNLSASDTNGVSKMKFSNDGSS